MRCILCLASAALLSCTPSPTASPVIRFPSRLELHELASAASQAQLPVQSMSVDSWSPTTAVPLPGAQYSREDRWDELVMESLSNGARAHASAELRCAAHEIARFYVEKGAYPDESLREFLVERCGSSLPFTEMQVRFAQIGEDTRDADHELYLERQARAMLEPQIAETNLEFGLGFARSQGYVTLVLLTGKPRVRLRESVRVASDGRITITGDVLAAAGFVQGFVTQGSFGVRACESDRAVPMPAFRLTCPVLPSDEASRVEITTGSPGAQAFHLVARLLVPHREPARLTYSLEPVAAVARPSDAADFRAGVVQALNEARTHGAARALIYEPIQSAANERLVPRFAKAFLSGDGQTLERIEQGLIAGWDVAGTIRKGAICSALTESATTSARLVAKILRSPLARWKLLDPRMSRIAVGTAALDPSGRAALIATYRLFEPGDDAADEEAVYAELGELRRVRGLPPVERIPSDPALIDALAKARSQSLPSALALDGALHEMSQNQGLAFTGSVVETSDLEHLTFPEAVVTSKGVLEIGVTHYRAPGAAWGQHVIFLVGLPRTGRHLAGVH